MSTLPSLDARDFGGFFRAVHDVDPFPWQERLIRQVIERGWPDMLDLPTGTGKTAALDVAVFALALQAGVTVRSVPLRVIYVVDRRTIVDQAHDRAERIRKSLLTSNHDVVQRVRERLASFSEGAVPLRTALLRGGVARDDVWARTPDQPLIAVSTVDQVGSRLLFRGYGVTDGMKPVHAGLLGCDVLYLLDEVHLSQPFRETLSAVGGCYRTWAERPLPSPFVVAEMSATPGRASTSSFRLDDADRRHPILTARLSASKPVSLVSSAPRGFANEIEKHVLAMLSGRSAATVAVIVNRVKTARELHERLRHVMPGGGSVHFLTGRMRPFDRDALEQGLLPRIRAGRVRRADDYPIVVVSTQSIEAGADFDFDGIVSECASLDALRQRFGRLDRLGTLAGSARGVVIARTDSLKDDPVYGDAIGNTWNWLQANGVGQTIDFGSDTLAVPSDAGERGLLTPKAHAPILLPSHIDAWVQTQPMPAADPDIALWLHGPRRGVADVQIVWRADLTADLLNEALDGGVNATAAVDTAVSIVEALPPVSAEAMSVSFVAARRWLEGGTEPDSFDVEGAAEIDDATLPRPEFQPRNAALRWQGEQSGVIPAKDLRPGQTIVVPALYGGIAHGNWAPASNVPVDDVAELASLRQGRPPTLRLHNGVATALFGSNADVPKPTPLNSEVLDDRGVVFDWLQRQSISLPNGELSRLVGQLLHAPTSLRVERLSSAPRTTADEYFVVVGKRSLRRHDDNEFDDPATTSDPSRSSFTGVEVPLADHHCRMARRVSACAERVGLPSDIVAALHLAAEWHDAGKADPRFQRWLHGGSEFKALVQSAPLAKSRVRLASRAAIRMARERARYPARGRHELMSLALITSAQQQLAARADDWSLVQHLVATHHGYCRPLSLWTADREPVDISFSQDGVTCTGSSAHELARLDSGIADRFWHMVRRYGWWGLAWLETVFRLADHRTSAIEQMGGGKPDA